MIQDTMQRLWLQSYDEEVSAQLHYENVPLYTYLDRTATASPKRPAIVFNHCTINYARLKYLAETVAANLRAQGVRHGDRVAIMLPNLPQTIISYWGVLKAGAVVVMTNPLYMEKELTHHLTDSGARFLITLDRLYAKIAPLRGHLPELRKIFVTGVEDGLHFPFKHLYLLRTRRAGDQIRIPFDQTALLPWKQLLKSGAAPVQPHLTPHRDLAVLQYTGGTTGVSKGVMLTHANMGANVHQCLAMLHRLGEKQETVLGLLPYFHIYGLTVCLNFATSIGATLVPFPRFAPIDVLKTIHKLRPTIFPSAPAVFQALLQHKDIQKYDLSSIQYCISGSAPIPQETINTFKDLTGSEIIEGFGLTEASPITHLNPLRKTRKIGSIGLPFPDTDACIVDMEVGSLALPPGKVGELVIRGPQVMHGYWNRPDETATALRNGWLYTGDIAYMDEQGYFFIVDRKKDMIISGGYNIYPREIDEVLYEHPDIQEAVTVGIAHPTRGEIVKAFVVPRQGVELPKSEIIGYCRQKLANYKVPKKIEFRTELPKTMVGKVLRRALREEEEQKKASS